MKNAYTVDSTSTNEFIVLQNNIQIGRFQKKEHAEYFANHMNETYPLPRYQVLKAHPSDDHGWSGWEIDDRWTNNTVALIDSEVMAKIVCNLYNEKK